MTIEWLWDLTHSRDREALVLVFSHSAVFTERLSLLIYFFIFLFLETVSFYISLAVLKHTLCRPDWPPGHRDTPASAFPVLGLMACATTRLNAHFFKAQSLAGMESNPDVYSAP